MTISYQQQVATSSGLGVFWKLLFKWKGSIYKLVWQNLLLYLVLYYALSLIYRFGLDVSGKEKFEHISIHCREFADLIPVTFVLGFYVSIIITRYIIRINRTQVRSFAAGGGVSTRSYPGQTPVVSSYPLVFWAMMTEAA